MAAPTRGLASVVGAAGMVIAVAMLVVHKSLVDEQGEGKRLPILVQASTSPHHRQAFQLSQLSLGDRKVPARGAHGSRVEVTKHVLGDSAALNDLLAFYDQLPTSSPLPRDARHKELPPTARKLGSRAAYKDLGEYFDSVPTHNVNALHSRSGTRHVKPPFASYSAKKASQDLGDYFQNIPTRGGNAFHQPAAEIKQELNSSPRQTHLAVMHPATTIEKASSSASTSNHQVSLTQHSATSKPTLHSGFPEKTRSSLEVSVTIPKKSRSHSSRNKLRTDWTALNDPSGPDPDAPTGTEEERHADGYDTQYGLTHKLGRSKLEETPAGDVLTHLVSREVGGSIAKDEDEQEDLPRPQEGGALHLAVRGSPVNAEKHEQGNVGMPPLARQEATMKPWSPMPYWKIIGQKGPLTWKVSKRFKEQLQEAVKANPKSLKAKLLLHEAHQHDLWRKMHDEAVEHERPRS
ncbi:hypothetical protein GUITHDRAFT_161825 [Guillardia theta CCMP2712]|uniref:Uncharacterized protein n=1 Tax=Guillardia theta (strain CCMP2712) TaxID=905079 RepID=L1JQU5_GUITC|nr:hypothetical protein GUITHDRAFT_161825 [Guillardia theta CCMP2712]EKX50570.1 hypothetical protein GUITHDRAFT_161825 [Guillardia theta CCMP2712]|eukprot:XP_005837550.1 hypothetical protein GUITHDRAFT_161825 [Guillardia theta CCMP2712]